MRTLIFAAIAALSIGSGSAFAESGENYEWAYSPLVKPNAAQTVKAPAVAPTSARDSAVIGYSTSKTYDMRYNQAREMINHGGG